MCYFPFRYRTYNPDGSVLLNQIRWYSYDSSLTIDQGVAQFQGLSPAGKLTQSTLAEPTQTGYHRVLRRADIIVTDLGAA